MSGLFEGNTNKVFLDDFDSPLGRIWVASDSNGIVRVLMPSQGGRKRLVSDIRHRFNPVNLGNGGPVIPQFAEELEEYFSGSLTTFRTPFQPRGTPFQQRAWKIVSQIPFGRTRTYGWVADRLRIPGGARAVGQANRFNPVPLLIPCHRVTAGGGKLGGYTPGIEQKRWLLQWENQNRNSRSL